MITVIIFGDSMMHYLEAHHGLLRVLHHRSSLSRADESCRQMYQSQNPLSAGEVCSPPRGVQG